MAFSTVAPAFIIHTFNSFVLITLSLRANSLFHYYVEHFVDYSNFDPLVSLVKKMFSDPLYKLSYVSQT